MLNWSQPFSIRVFLDNNHYPALHKGYECLLAVGTTDGVSGDTGDLLDEVLQLHRDKQDWLFGHISYDYKNLLEPKLRSSHPWQTGFPLLHFFIPETVCYLNHQQTILTIESFTNPDAIYAQLCAAQYSPAPLPKVAFTAAVSRAEYIANINKLRQHIAEGDCYEINYCTEGYAQEVSIRPVDVFLALNAISPAPFACFYQLNDAYLMCASPERYLKKTDNTVLSQPIKGTARRDADPAKDITIKEQLYNDIKERAENVMIVDLVRNDLARSCATGSIRVEELFGIHTYPQVHHMISTITGTQRPDVPFTDVIRHSFPMGSMTGAPKHKVMQLIEQYEVSRRELFSGTVGYISPQGDFDFNVIIRSLFYNAATKYLAYQTGGAITYDSVAEQEWEEMRLKAWALERIFS